MKPKSTFTRVSFSFLIFLTFLVFSCSKVSNEVEQTITKEEAYDYVDNNVFALIPLTRDKLYVVKEKEMLAEQILKAKRINSEIWEVKEIDKGNDRIKVSVLFLENSKDFEKYFKVPEEGAYLAKFNFKCKTHEAVSLEDAKCITRSIDFSEKHVISTGYSSCDKVEEDSTCDGKHSADVGTVYFYHDGTCTTQDPNPRTRTHPISKTLCTIPGHD